MKKTKQPPLITEIIAAMLVLLLIYAALSKWFHFTESARTLLNIPLLAPYHIFITIAVPALELIIALLIIIPGTRAKGLLSAAILLGIFTAYILYILLTSSADLPCTCGGIIAKMTWRQHLVFNAFFIILSLWAYKTLSRNEYISGEAEHLQYSRQHF